MPLRDATGQQARARNGAGWRGRVKTREPRALLREPVEARGLDGRLGIETGQIAVAQIVGGDNQDIRRRSDRAPAQQQACELQARSHPVNYFPYAHRISFWLAAKEPPLRMQ